MRFVYFLAVLHLSFGVAAASETYTEAHAAPLRRAVQEVPYVSQPVDRLLNAQQVAVSNIVSTGRRVGRPLQNGGVENQLLVGYGPASWLLIEASAAVAETPAGTTNAFGGNARFQILSQNGGRPLNLILSGGALREHEGTTVLTAAYTAGRDFGRFNASTSGVFEKPLAKNRDEVDAILSLGLSYAFLKYFRAGLESVGEDLEAFVEEEEAEGGARLLAGPTLVAELLDKRLNLAMNALGGVAYVPRPTLDGKPAPAEAFGLRFRAAYTF